MDEFNLELVRGDKARGSDVPTNAKEWTAFLVDCGDAMYRTYRGPVGSLQGLTLFQAALKQISGIVASRLAHGVEDDITIVGWNRGAPDVWHAGGPPTPALLERLDDMVSSNAKDIVFGKNDAREGRATSLAESLRDAMVSAVLEFDTDEWNNYKIDVSLVVAVWTADNTGACPQGDDSGGGGDPAFRTITELIHRRNIKFHAVLLDDLKLDVPRQCVSDASTLWARVCGSSEGSRDHNTRSIVQNPFALPLSTRLVSHTDAFKMVRLSGTSRTTSIMVPCHLGSFGVFDMRFHSLTSAAWPRCVGASKWLDVTDSAVLVPKSVGLAAGAAAGAGGSKWPDGPGSGGLAAYPELGGDLPDDGLKPYYPKPVGKKESAAPRIVLDEQTVENLKSPVPFRRLYVDINAVVGVAVEFDIDDDSSLSSDPFALALPTRLVDSNPPPHSLTPSPPHHPPTAVRFLVGFKSRAWLEDAWQMREAYFMRPEETSSADVLKRCKALHDVMVERDVLALCGFIRSDQTEPRLAAFIPSLSKETGEALGFSLLELPFADDIRHPECAADAMGKPQHASAIGTLCAEKLVSLHRVRKSDLPGVAMNPAVERHFAVLESMLLDRPTLADGDGSSSPGMSRDSKLGWADFKRLHNL